MTKTTEQRHLNILMEMTDYIVNEVASAELIEINPQWCNDTDVLLLTLTFSTGTRNHDITLTWDGTVYDVSKNMPRHLLVDIHNGICAGYLKGIMEQSTKTTG